MDRETFIKTYAPLAKEQMRLYGIPASVTLAQMALESGWGSGRAIREGNNAFCVKGSFNGQYILISDDKPNERFKKYDSLSQSFTDHSRVLLLDRYKNAQHLTPDDYRGWCRVLQSGGYATDPKYAEKLIAMIEDKDYNFARFDYEVIKEASNSGEKIGSRKAYVNSDLASINSRGQAVNYGNFSMPLHGSDNLVITSGYGHRDKPTKGASSEHRGLDLKANNQTVYATEDGGKVISSKNEGAGGETVRVEYSRSNGDKYEVVYMHLKERHVKVGDTVNANDKLGVSGSTGVSTGPHLHLTVKKNDSYINPALYLADIAARGNMATNLIGSNKEAELFASHKHTVTEDLHKDAEIRSLNQDQQHNLALAQQQSPAGSQLGSILNAFGIDDKSLGLDDVDSNSNDIISYFISMLIKQCMASAGQMLAEEMVSKAPVVAEPPNNSDDKQEDNDYTLYRQQGINPETARNMSRREMEAGLGSEESRGIRIA